ncbi:uncharacterized protein LOC120015094 isoform X1 [Tripterygium wilfordii]|uniref:uncharacterized protein LOC120015094 isoform X1 n=1 Tax=Tripterygium wilfordii TaxID=458696 RepID=UPI0018F83A6D|nr:uncharacterized protein LOC120015094 isoform X1 [Tripterygium wilfordii]
MEDMDIDQVVEIPDTPPDRIAAQHNNGRKIAGKQTGASIAVHSSNSALLDGGHFNRLSSRDRLGTESGNHRKPHLLSQKDVINVDEKECRNNSRENFPVESSCASRNGPLFRKMAMERNSAYETKHPFGDQRKDKGKDLFAKFPPKSSSFQVNDGFLDLSEHNTSWRMIDMAPDGASKAIQSGEIRQGQIATRGGGSLHAAPDRPKTCDDSRKGKGKLDVNGCKDAASAANHGKGINVSGSSQCKTEKQVAHHFVTTPRVSGQKRLVRNGCISPHNIAARAKRGTELPFISKDVEVTRGNNVDFNGQCQMDISEIVSDVNNCGRVKGKGVATYPCKMMEHDVNISRRPSRVLAINNEEPNRTSDVSRNANRCSQGWRNTHSHSKKIDPSSDAAGHVLGPHNDFSCSVNQQHANRGEERDNRNGHTSSDLLNSPEDLSTTQTASSILSEFERRFESHNSVNIKKRQKQVGMTSRNDGERSSAVSDDSDIVFLGSCGESSHSNSFRLQSYQNEGVMDPVFDIDEFSPEMRCNMSEDIGNIGIDNLEVKARQLEADEILARELQEQFYHEVPAYGSFEIDENIAWALQQEESAIPDVSYPNQRVSFPRSSTSRLHRQPHSRSFQNLSNRRGAQTRISSSRTARLRSRILGRSPTGLPRERNFQFPPNMDLDMRLDILEALEAAFDDASDGRTTRNGRGHGLGHSHFDQDFNDGNYELFLALDENNHQHTGASANQINNLPQSIVQSENIEEACAICLETPTIGETVRHLPCLHKFHKDCIDPWLSRKTSCPVCKLSIT